MAQAAFNRVMGRKPLDDEYRSFAREFPTLVHTCGLAQAVAFATSKGVSKPAYKDYVNDLAAVLTAAGHVQVMDMEGLASQTRAHPVMSYLRLSRDALTAAVWLKRYVEALKQDSAKGPSQPETTRA
jgi:CRISPR-associated protein Cmr5